jgi:bifunctional DNA-binding transcriptional regulator/antitoxin component of YhaV-PrlF toxin-antitoxin module
MGFISKVQVIQRGETNRQFYFICPAPLAQAMEIEKGESIEWVVVDKQTLMIRRVQEGSTVLNKTGSSSKKGKGKEKRGV